ncbi:hypothetical protein [Paenibacillus taiwanensis]|uniref:hypothetical protein n=1 Tax=Paenibacillus taiwanensis TaxID=401638 RepID=UPI00042005A5|nr:hypothetical protein [Paenibacillus taiwanensis]
MKHFIMFCLILNIRDGEGDKLITIYKRTKAILLLMFMFTGLAFAFGAVPQAEAGFWDWVTGVTEIPSEVEQLRSKYDEMEQSIIKSEQHYKEATDRLASDNEKLRGQNEQLMQRILQLETKDLEQRQQVRRIATVVITGIGLLLLYFVLTRVLRVMVWQRRR